MRLPDRSSALERCVRSRSTSRCGGATGSEPRIIRALEQAGVRGWVAVESAEAHLVVGALAESDYPTGRVLVRASYVDPIICLHLHFWCVQIVVLLHERICA